MKLTLFFDGYCPLCVAEMNKLRLYDERSLLVFEDIQAQNFAERFPHIDPEAADRYLHAQYQDGTMIYGLDVTHQAWRQVGRQRWLAVLRWPAIRWIADIAYTFFARNRYSISYLLTGQRRCEICE